MEKEIETGRRTVIGFVVNTTKKPCRDVMLGWQKCMKEHPGFSARFFFAGSATTVLNLMRFVSEGLDGVLMCGIDMDLLRQFMKARPAGLPVVLCTSVLLTEEQRAWFGVGGAVMFDNAVASRKIADMFVRHEIENFAFLSCDGKLDRSIGSIRCAVFRESLASMLGRDPAVSELWYGTCEANGDVWDRSIEQMEDWVKALSLPCGVYASGDYAAVVLAEACSRVGVDVPGRIEIVGVNNSQEICENSSPTITSIQPGYEKCAIRSVAMLCELIEDGCCKGGCFVSVPEYSLVERGSTLSGRNNGNLVTRAREYIRVNACSGINVMDVVVHLGVSRRTLELAVRDSGHGGMLSMIRKVRLDNMCRLLVSTDVPITEVVTSSGYNLGSHVSYLFKNTYGMTMRQYRMKNKRK